MTMAPACVLGVDGGGTKTVAILSDLSGQVRGRGRAGPSDIYMHPRAVEEVALAVRGACAEAGCDPGAVASAVYSLRGADWPEDFEFWQDALRARDLGRDIHVVNDAVGGLSAERPEGHAVALVCGTGAAIGSRNAAGATWHSSFWQLTQGGAELGDKALRAVYRADLGIGPPTRLTAALLEHFGARDVEALLHAFTARVGARPKHRKSVVPLLMDEAEAGDAAARGIVVHHGEALAEFVAAAARRVGILGQPFDLLLAGGVFRHPSELFRTSLVDAVRTRAAGVTVVRALSEPVRGAVTLALQRRAVPITPAVSANLTRTFPDAGFFHTGAVPRDEGHRPTAADDMLHGVFTP